jgi:hypothetical protein
LEARLRWIVLCCLVASPGVATAAATSAVTLFGGVLIDNPWEDVFLSPWEVEFLDPGLVGVAGSVRLAEPVDGLAIELEAQVVRHWGEQDHWEANLPIVTARWTRFPWDATVDSSAAFGIGPSLASETPAAEVAREGDSSPAMTYWMIELEAGAPESPWRVVGRLHHRSTAFGAFGDAGGSNALAVGVRRLF